MVAEHEMKCRPSGAWQLSELRALASASVDTQQAHERKQTSGFLVHDGGTHASNVMLRIVGMALPVCAGDERRAPVHASDAAQMRRAMSACLVPDKDECGRCVISSRH